MRARDAKYAVIEYLEREGWEVYERRENNRRFALGHMVAVDPNTGMTLVVRALNGKRPPRSKAMLRDRAKEGLCDVVGYVDPRDGSVSLRLPASSREAA
jgi:hypothetical protein